MPLVEKPVPQESGCRLRRDDRRGDGHSLQGQEEKSISRDRLLQGLRFMLERPQWPTRSFPTWARWQDWSSMDRLVELFKNANEDSIWVRVPVINYLRACPLPEAKKHLDELAALDPDNFKKATAFKPGHHTRGRRKNGDDTAADTKEPAEKRTRPVATRVSPTRRPLRHRGQENHAQQQ